MNPQDNASPGAIAGRMWNLTIALAPWLVAVALAASALAPDGRAWWRRLWIGIAGVRIRVPFTTANQRWRWARAEAEGNHESKSRGYLKRSTEVDAERALARKPRWWIDAREPGDFLLYNGGYKVSDVRLQASEAEFVFEHAAPPVFVGEFGDDGRGGAAGKFFGGNPTDKGLADGVKFTVHWRDQNLDPQEATVYLEPKHLKLIENPQDSYKRGYDDGFSAGRRQSNTSPLVHGSGE